MACVRDDGSLSPTAKRLMKAIPEPATEEDVAMAADLPLYRVRSVARELIQAGLVEVTDGKFRLTKTGEERLADQS
jgi:predicted methyltransferase